MSLLNVDNFIIIKLYYTFEETGSGKKLVILDDDKARDLLKDELKSKNIEILETKWKQLTWKVPLIIIFMLLLWPLLP